MEAIGFYLIKSALWLSVFALIYYLSLRNEGFFFINRLFLISGMMAALIFPLITVRYLITIPYSTASTSIGLPEITAIQQEQAPWWNWQTLLFILLMAGMLLVLARLIVQTSKIINTIHHSPIERYGSTKVIQTDIFPFSFSFFSFVFVSSSASSTEIREIVRHEAEHIRQYHWIDLLLAELLCTIQWFNPVVWLYAHFIKQNHEYLADQKALQCTSNPGVYKAVLINQVLGGEVIRLGNSFSYSLNKKRFTMMKNRSTSTLKKFKTLFVLPLIGLLFYGFARPEYRYAAIDKENTIKTTQAKGKTIKGTVVQEDNTPLPGTSIVVTGTTTGAVADRDGHFKLKDIPEGSEIAFSFVGFKTVVKNADFKNEMKVVMLKDTTVIEDGVHVIGYAPKGEEVIAIGYGTQGKDSLQVLNKAFISDKNPLIIVDDQPVTQKVLNALDPNTFESITVLKDESATSLYGEKAKDGVVIVKLKNPENQIHPSFTIKANGGTYKTKVQPLIIVDGKEDPNTNIKDIDPETIKSINVLKGESAANKYGEKGKNGVIEITLKKEGEEVVVTNPDAIGNQQNKDKERPVFFVVEDMPQFPGGEVALREFLSNETKYPVEAQAQEIEGRVYISFVISATGQVEEAKVAREAHPLLDTEALRVINAMPQWKPGRQRGKNVAVQYTIPINFALQKQSTKQEIDVNEEIISIKKNKASTTETKDHPTFSQVEEMPEFPGGEMALQAFIQEQLRYIKIEVTQNQNVLLNGEPIKIEDISDKLISIKSSDGTNKADRYVIQIDVHNKTKMEMVTAIKQQLRKANMLKIEYSSK